MQAMLSWPPGLRETDGIWAKHWYGEVAKSTSFQPYRIEERTGPGTIARNSRSLPANVTSISINIDSARNACHPEQSEGPRDR